MDSEHALAKLRTAVNGLREFSRTPYLKDFYLGNSTEIRIAADAIETYLTGASRDTFQSALNEVLNMNPMELPNDEGGMCLTDEELGDYYQQEKLFSCLDRMLEAAVPAILKPAPGAAPFVHDLELHLAQLQALQPRDPRIAQFYKDSFAGLEETVNALQSYLTETSWNELRECWLGYSHFAPEKFKDDFPGVGKPVYVENMLQLMTKDMIRAAKGELVYA